MANNLLLTSASAMVLIGTLYPLLADALNLGKVSVGPPYFGLLFIVLMTPLVLLVPFGPLTYWQREQGSRVAKLLWPWAALALVSGALAFFIAPQGRFKAAVGIAAAVWVAAGTARFIYSRLKSKTAGQKMTLEMVGMSFAHMGIAVFLVGALLTEALSTQRELAMKPGDTVTVGANTFTFKGAKHVEGPNYVSDQGILIMRTPRMKETTLLPEKRKYVAGGQVMTESAISRNALRDIYVALGESLDAANSSKGSSSWAVRIHIKPFVRWIWFGAILMALGAFVTAADKRFKGMGGATS
jgi:cytochrome c-type biogenesis protein CcmF